MWQKSANDQDSKINWWNVSLIMNYPATRDPIGSRSPGCCYHPWNPPPTHVYPSCRKCLRPVLTLQHCALLSTCLHTSHLSLCHEPHRSRSAETTPVPFNRFDWRSSSASNYHRYHHHHSYPPPSDFYIGQSPCSTSCYDSRDTVKQKPPNLQTIYPTNRVTRPPALDITHRWIGEETKRSLPLHVYKYYLSFIKEYQRHRFKVNIYPDFDKREEFFIAPQFLIIHNAQVVILIKYDRQKTLHSIALQTIAIYFIQ